MATEKLSEGIRAFVKDLRALRGPRRAADGGAGCRLTPRRQRLLAQLPSASSSA